jgi:hypothetical protein
MLDYAVLQRFEDEIRMKGFDVFMIDPFVSFHSVLENDNGCMDLLLKEGLGGIASRTNSAGEVFHHPGKPKARTGGDDGRRRPVERQRSSGRCAAPEFSTSWHPKKHSSSASARTAGDSTFGRRTAKPTWAPSAGLLVQAGGRKTSQRGRNRVRQSVEAARPPQRRCHGRHAQVSRTGADRRISPR